MPDKVQMRAIVHGRVQGVFFRDTTRRLAKELNICGTVKNLPDGTVEIIAQGQKEAIEKLIQSLKEHPGMAEISNIEKALEECEEGIKEFRIIF